MIAGKIKHLLSSQNKRVKDLCAHINMTDAGLRKIYARDSCETSTLALIADFFGVSPAYFFGSPAVNVNSSGAGSAVSVSGPAVVSSLITPNDNNDTDKAVLIERIKALEAVLAEKERLIKLYEKMQG